MSVSKNYFKELANLIAEEKKRQENLKKKQVVTEAPANQIKPDTSIPSKAAEYLSKSRKNDNIPTAPENIESQRWNDPLRRDANEKFVTFKDMNEHYTTFLQRIQQQMSTMSGGGETRLRYLDDVNASTIGANKYLTYNSSTGKFVFSEVNVSNGLQSQSGVLSTKTSTSFGYQPDGTMILNPATETTVGGIRLGPGVTLNGLDQLIIDTEGLDFSFGDFFAYTEVGPNGSNAAYLSSINDNEDIVIASNGTGQVDIIGRFSIFTTAGANNITTADPVFSVNDDGDVSATTLDIVNSRTLNLMAPLNVSINEQGLTKTPAVVSGVVAQFTGRDDNYATVVIDAYGEDPSRGAGGGLVFRTGLGTNDTPTAVANNSILGRVETTGWASDGYAGKATTSLRFVANEDFTSTSRGGRIELWAIPNGNTTVDHILTVDETGIVFIGERDIDNLSQINFDPLHDITQHPHQTGSFCWNNVDQTLNIFHPGGVVQQVGQELYGYVRNNTGSTITNGTAVRFSGAETNGTARLEVAPFEADGTFPSLYGFGIATQDIADGEDGRVTVWGKVRDVNTTGGAENWQVGDILYVSPTVAGALTNVKPTAPNNVVPMAAVLRVDATLGEIFVRPTIEQKKNYGVFNRTTDYQPASPNTAYAITVDNTEITSGITVGTPASRFVADQSGLYQVDWTIHWATAGNAGDEDTWYTWIRKNGVDVPNTMRSGGIDGESVFVTSSSSRIISLAADDYIEIAIAVSDVNVRLDAVAATAFGPSTAALEVNIIQIQL